MAVHALSVSILEIISRDAEWPARCLETPFCLPFQAEGFLGFMVYYMASVYFLWIVIFPVSSYFPIYGCHYCSVLSKRQDLSEIKEGL